MASNSAGKRASLPVFLLSALLVLISVMLVGNCGGDDPKPAQPAAAAQDLAALSRADVDPSRLVVDFRDGTTKAQFDALESGWGIDLEFNSVAGPATGVTLAKIDPARLQDLLNAIRKDPSVESAEPLFRYRASWVPNDPQFKAQWNFQLIGMPEAWEVSRGKGVTVAVVDTGIAYEDSGEFKVVRDLKGARFAPGYDFVNDDEHAHDDQGHGTHVAGTIAQSTDNAEGVAGVAFEATLMPVKVLDANGSGSSADVADGIRWAADHGAKVINLSLGGGARSEVMAAAVAHARKKGAVVVCAAGNGGRGVVEYPAAYPDAVAVSAVGPGRKLAGYSSWGKELDIAAPGGDKSAREEDGVLQNTIAHGIPSQDVYAFYQGTSMATPHVAGVAALLFAAGASTPDEVEKALFAGADQSQTGAWNDKYGHGILSAKGALEALGAKPGKPWWKRVLLVLWAFVLWLITRMTLPAPIRRILKPNLGLVGSILLAVLGFFFLPWLGLGGLPILSALSEPMPAWGDGMTGASGINPLFYSSIIPILFALFGFRRASLSGSIAGLAIGFAAVMLLKAVTGAQVAWMPFALLSMPWLVINALLAFLIARAAMMSGARREP